MEGKSLPCSVPSRGDCPISIDGGWSDPVPLLAGLRDVHSHICLSVCPCRHPLPPHLEYILLYSGVTEGSTTVFDFSSQPCTQGSGALASTSPKKDNWPWFSLHSQQNLVLDSTGPGDTSLSASQPGRICFSFPAQKNTTLVPNTSTFQKPAN